MNVVKLLARLMNQVAKRTHQASDQHERLEAAMNSLDVGLLMTFKDNDVISYNAVLPKILHVDKRLQHGKLTLGVLEERIKASNFDLGAAIDTCERTGDPFDVKEFTHGNDILRVYGAPIGYHTRRGATGTVILFEDITEAKIRERSKDEFFSIASHELRTPLTSIKGNTSMIMQYYPEVLKDKNLSEMIHDIHSSSVRLISVVNDFLDVSRLEQSKVSFNYEPVSLEELIEGVTYEMQVVLKTKDLYLKLDKVTLDRLPKVWADKNRLKQVIYNLVGNASKFTESGGITLSAEVEGDHVKVLVVDTGHGMTAKSQQLLFHKFQQASSSLLTRDTTRGTGLGLYISKMIVETMGGKIKLEKSVEGKGSTFSFTVPVATPERLAAAARTTPPTGASTDVSVEK
ncbi:MAG TPA: HAMP domain-containing sensor histidine kinase [Patescibacteria group bacterium]|nr:HAMP domain-containing sensor histidine kinase [Patescibacteria group bacterium]